MRTLIIGSGGRESILAWRMAENENSSVYAFMKHENPTIIDLVKKTGGDWKVGNILNPQEITSYAKEHRIDIVMVSSDEPLAVGVVDVLIEKGIKVVGPTKAGSEIEWNKEYSRNIINAVCPEANPLYYIAHSQQDIDDIFNKFGNVPVAVKPVGLTGGKGVKIVGPHLKNNQEAKEYATTLLNNSKEKCVIIEECVIGSEFTIQAITDGKNIVFPPSSFDYPYRYEGDVGPGTGGMGSYTVRSKNLPFMSIEHYNKGCEIIRKIIKKLADEGRHFTGIMNSGFFLTNKQEVKVIEFNSRFGDPEALNIMQLIEGNWCKIMNDIVEQKLDPKSVYFKDLVSHVVYLVSPDYALTKKLDGYSFELDVEEIRKNGCEVFFASAVKTGHNLYKTVGRSRCVAIATTGNDLEETSRRISETIKKYVKGPLEWRTDIGTKENIDSMKKRVCRIK